MPSSPRDRESLGKEVLEQVKHKSSKPPIPKGQQTIPLTNEILDSLLVDFPPVEDAAIPSELSKRYDQLNALWKMAEDELRQYGVGECVNFVYLSEFHERRNSEMAQCLAWAWTKGSWRLCYGFSEEDSDFDYTPILDAALSLRQSCFEHFPELKSRVVVKAREAIPKLDDSIAKFASLLKKPKSK